MALSFKDPGAFFKETAAVTGGAAAAGAVVGAAGLLGAPMVAAAGGAALFGGAIAATLTRETPAALTAFAGKPALRAVVGAIGGAVAALGFSALSWRLGLGLGGTFAAGALGGLALGMLLGGDGVKHKISHLMGMAGATTVGAVGAIAVDNAARFATSEGAPVLITSTTLAGLLGLWIAAGAGLRRLEPQGDPLIERANALLAAIAEPLKTKVAEALATWAEARGALDTDSEIPTEAREQSRALADQLFERVLETGEGWHQVQSDLKGPKARSLDDKLKDLEARLAATDDDVTRGHLSRAQAALLAQKSAVDDLRRNLGRAEAVVDVQVALLERLGLAISQHRVSERERFFVELAAVADEATRVSDDVDALSQAIAAADSLSDRRALADLESSARRALGQAPQSSRTLSELAAEPIAGNDAPSSSAAPVASLVESGRR